MMRYELLSITGVAISLAVLFQFPLKNNEEVTHEALDKDDSYVHPLPSKPEGEVDFSRAEAGERNPLEAAASEPKSEKEMRALGLLLRDGGIEQVVQALEEGGLDLGRMDEASKRKATGIIVAKTTPEQLARLMGKGLLPLERQAISDAVSPSLRKRDSGDIDQSAIIKKMGMIASASGASLTNTETWFNGETRNAFDKAVIYGMDEVLVYLGQAGVRPALGEALWPQFLSSRYASGAAAKVLLDYGYTPSAENLSIARTPSFQESHPEIYGILKPYL